MSFKLSYIEETGGNKRVRTLEFTGDLRLVGETESEYLSLETVVRANNKEVSIMMSETLEAIQRERELFVVKTKRRTDSVRVARPTPEFLRANAILDGPEQNDWDEEVRRIRREYKDAVDKLSGPACSDCAKGEIKLKYAHMLLSKGYLNGDT